MKGMQIGPVKIGIDHSGNFTKGYVHDTDIGKFIETVVSDIEFDPATESAAAEATRISLETETVS